MCRPASLESCGLRFPALLIWLAVLASGCAAGRNAAPEIMRWDPQPDLPLAVVGHAVARHGSQWITLGGTYWRDGVKHWVKEGWIAPLRTGEWKPLAIPQPPSGAAFVSDDQFLYLVGGSLDINSTLKTGCRIDLASPAAPWQPLPELPEPRALARAAIVGHYLYVVGGTTDANRIDLSMRSVLRMNFQSPEQGWTPCAERPGEPASALGLAECGGRLYAFGGARAVGKGAKTVNTAAAHVYDPENNTWRRIRDLPAPVRGPGCVAIDDRFILLAGGCAQFEGVDRIFSDVYLYDTLKDTYTKAAPLPMGVLGSVMIRDATGIDALGGEDKPYSRTAKVFHAPLPQMPPKPGL